MINTIGKEALPTAFESKSSIKHSSFIFAILLFFLFLILTFILPPRSDEAGYFAALKDKHLLLRSTKSPKIVFVGGSNLAFGLDSKYIEKKFDKPVVNMGLCAPFGLRYILDEIKDDIHAGDIIVLVPEYGILQNTVDGCPDLIHAAEIYPHSIIFILRAYLNSPRSTFKLLDLIREIPSVKCDAFYRIMKTCWKDGKYDPSPLERWEVNDQIGSSARLCFDQYGDYFGHLKSANKVFTPLWGLVGSMDSTAASLINNFNQFAQRSGATVVLIPPAIPDKDYALSQYSMRSVKKWPDQKLDIAVLAMPERYSLPVEYFYEPPYHLNTAGRSLRTKMIAEDLEHYLTQKNQ